MVDVVTVGHERERVKQAQGIVLGLKQVVEGHERGYSEGKYRGNDTVEVGRKRDGPVVRKEKEGERKQKHYYTCT